MGLALVCEYLKGVGIDIAKPDVHITRMLGKSHLGFSNDDEASENEAVELMKELAKRNNITQTEVDRLMWWYCADGYWQICTKLSPKCAICVIRDDCNKGRSIKPLRHE
jgi:endonuclease III